MTPYYDEAGITIYHGDCRDILPVIPKADLMLTDPPYGINAAVTSEFGRGPNSHGGSRGKGKRNEKIVGDESPFNPSFLLEYASDYIIWGWNNFPNKLPRGACLVWIKRYDSAFGSFLSDAETAWMSKGRGVYCYRDLSNNGIATERKHPTQKPLPLMCWCLSFFPKAQAIIDPYMGSGTTLRAAKDMGRRAIGIEIEERYCEIAAKRLRQEVLPFERTGFNG